MIVVLRLYMITAALLAVASGVAAFVVPDGLVFGLGVFLFAVLTFAFSRALRVEKQLVAERQRMERVLAAQMARAKKSARAWNS